MLSAPVWWQDVWHTVIITVVSVSIQFVLGMLLALAMHRVIFARGTLRAIALVPYAIVAVVAAYSWNYAWSLDSGWIPKLLGLSSDPLSHPFGTYVAIIITEVWKNTPFMALLLLAGLALVPDELLEAAKVDGASAWQRFIRITIPLMKPAILVALLFRTLDAFRIFDTIYIFNQGANGTESISMLNYSTLLDRLNLGLGSAVSVHAVHARRDHRVRVHQGVRRRQPAGGRVVMRSTLARRTAWLVGAAFVVIVVCSLVPVLWIICCRSRPRPRRPTAASSRTSGRCPTTRTSSSRASSPARCATRSGSG